MAISKYTLYKYVKAQGTWRYCKAAYHYNGKIKPEIVFVNVKLALFEKHPEGRYYMSHNGQWIDAGTNALEAQRKRKQRLALDEFNRLSGKTSAQSAIVLPDSPDKITLAAAAEKYFANCEARGLDPESIRKYRAAVDPFVERCGVTYVDECRDNKQVLLNYMGWLRKQPVSQRTHSNPERTLHIPMIDFIGRPAHPLALEVSRMLAEKMGLSPHMLLFTLAALSRLFSGPDFRGGWPKYLGRLLLFNGRDHPPLIDTRWIGHALMRGFTALRWSHNTNRYRAMPRFMSMVDAGAR